MRELLCLLGFHWWQMTPYALARQCAWYERVVGSL